MPPHLLSGTVVNSGIQCVVSVARACSFVVIPSSDPKCKESLTRDEILCAKEKEGNRLKGKREKERKIT